MNCWDLRQGGATDSGVYTLQWVCLEMPARTFEVYCDMITDGGGWVVGAKRHIYDNTIPIVYPHTPPSPTPHPSPHTQNSKQKKKKKKGVRKVVGAGKSITQLNGTRLKIQHFSYPY